ncbi:unnamed protein product [Adineta steineri]|uniref:Sequestosome-1 n=1 Tax=Adineta steineri TaxID=433720 RepID=A0A818JW82_9BILA|nr:unnamed protein product [Adineta steineri]CAF3542214.1 unnamed protein product [Adineta steineri]
MATTYYIKVYYTKQNQQQPEIRRFVIDISPENDIYQELSTKIASFQSDNQLKDFTLQYIDEENERITFSSNDEFRSAIAFNKDANTLKVFVTINQTVPQQQENTTNQECHAGVTCDGCNGPITGFRYKCFVCPNYDLCEKCSSAGIHSEHNMIKITKPGSFPHTIGPQQNSFHGRRQRRTPPFVPNGQFIEQIQAQIPQWLPNQQNTALFRAHMQHHLDSIKANTQTHMQNSKQYLESVGQYLQKTLSPFGIDCEYHVDEQTTSTNQQEEQVPTENQQEEHVPTENQDEQVPVVETDSTHEPDAVPKYTNLTTIINNNEEQTASASVPIVEESTKITNPLEKAIDECLEKMKAMGFTDSNGALRELVRSKQGEINAVLDAINPRHYQS